jgi:hypothetical protein
MRRTPLLLTCCALASAVTATAVPRERPAPPHLAIQTGPSPQPGAPDVPGTVVSSPARLRVFVNSLNISHDPSGYTGARSAYLGGSWTGEKTLVQARFYLDGYLWHNAGGRRIDPDLTFGGFERAVKELFVRRTLPGGLELTVGDIRATAHSDNNKALYSGDGKPVHSDIVEVDRVLGMSLARDGSWGRVEVTVADRGRRDLRWDGALEAVRVSRTSADRRRQIQATFLNRHGDDAGGRPAASQWQAGAGGALTTPDDRNVFTAEYVRGNFLPSRIQSRNAFTVAYERRLLARSLSAVVDYEHITGETGVSGYEAGLGANLVSYARGGWLRLEGGYRYIDPRASGSPVQRGPFVRLGIVFDRGRGSVREVPTLAEALRPRATSDAEASRP